MISDTAIQIIFTVVARTSGEMNDSNKMVPLDFRFKTHVVDQLVQNSRTCPSYQRLVNDPFRSFNLAHHAIVLLVLYPYQAKGRSIYLLVVQFISFFGLPVDLFDVLHPLWLSKVRFHMWTIMSGCVVWTMSSRRYSSPINHFRTGHRFDLLVYPGKKLSTVKIYPKIFVSL